MFPLYTKSFGGKIWTNLHSVSPDNFLGKKFKIPSLEISRQKFIWTSPRAKNNFKVKTPILARKKNSENNILTYLLVEMKMEFSTELISSKYFSSFARDDVSDKNLLPTTLFCNTG